MTATEEPPTTDAPVRPDGSHKRAAADDTPDPLSPEALAEYDAETMRLIVAAETECQEAEGEYEAANADAKDLKKRAEAKTETLRELIRDRQKGRGKPPQKTLLDMIPKPVGKWRGRTVAEAMRPHKRIADALASFGVVTLGDLDEQFTAGNTFGLMLTDVHDMRAVLREIIDAEGEAAAPPEERPAGPDPLAELWREFPVERWKLHGLTPKDVEKLHAGEIKGGGAHPILTVGDLNRFVTPNPANPGFARGYSDIKGIGAAGSERISEAETAFWGWWNKGGDREFAAERGIRLDAHDATPAGDGIEAPGDAGGDGASGEPGDVPAGAGAADFASDPEAEAAFDYEAHRKPRTSAPDGDGETVAEGDARLYREPGAGGPG